ncbi:MAG: acetylglutamate kinase [Robiginitomaculum sp.]|nr:MAG: acetylglutamate kinase [Robiginitomaculum sp.]
MTDYFDAEAKQTRQVIRQLLSGMSEGREVRAYLQKFSEMDRARFAVIKVGGAILRDEMAALAGALAFLQKLGLAPIVVHGGGPQIDAALAAKGIETARHEGLRITGDAAMHEIASTLRGLTLDVLGAIRAKGGHATAIGAGAVLADLVDEENLGRVGAPKELDLSSIHEAADEGSIPVLTCVGETADGRLANINADALVASLTKALRPQKIIFLTGTGAILDGEGEPISFIHLANDYDRLMGQDWLNGGMRLKLAQIKDLLSDLPLGASVAITRPGALVKELFTHGGSGTLVRRGEQILTLTDKAKLDQGRLGTLIEAAFGRTLSPSYWDDLPLERAIVSAQMRAAAILIPLPGALYLDKFAVDEDARGEGLGAAVWAELVEAAPVLFWRSHPDNSFNAFYHANAQGSAHQGDWRVFWRGTNDWKKIGQYVETIAAIPPSFTDKSGQG